MISFKKNKNNGMLLRYKLFEHQKQFRRIYTTFPLVSVLHFFRNKIPGPFPGFRKFYSITHKCTSYVAFSHLATPRFLSRKLYRLIKNPGFSRASYHFQGLSTHGKCYNKIQVLSGQDSYQACLIPGFSLVYIIPP